jgi:hypothetical protein
MKLLITGGITSKFSRLRELVGGEREITNGCIDLLEPGTGIFSNLMRIKVPDEFRDVTYKRDFRLTSASIHNNILYIASPTQVYLYRWPDLDLIRVINSPYFNDVHHVTVLKDKIYIVSTGLDAVIRFSMQGDFEEMQSVYLERISEKFDLSKDYRMIGSLKPHDSHPNYVFEVNDDIWSTRFRQRDIINLRTREVVSIYKPAGMHDGFTFKGKIYFTAVDGHIIELDAKEKKVTNVIDLNKLDGRGIPLGWCRGLHVDDEYYFVGFSILRTTKLEENVHWLTKKVRGKGEHEILPSRIIQVSRKDNKIVNEFIMKYPNLDMIFSILKVG